MREYLTEAIVLDKEPNGDLDLKIALFTKRFGKLKVKAKSARRITSKLSPHLEPGNLVRARLIEKNGLQVVDALKQGSVAVRPPHLFLLNFLLAEAEPERALWESLIKGTFGWEEALAILGWDPREAECTLCGTERPAFFDIRGQEFFCGACMLRRGVANSSKNPLIGIFEK